MWEQRRSSVPAIRLLWRAYVDEPAWYVDDASEHWGISFIQRPDGTRAAELAGPRLTARPIEAVRGDAYWGVELAAHVVLPGVDKGLIQGDVLQLDVTDGGVLLGGREHRWPSWPELESFVEVLLAAGILVDDDEVRRALGGDDTGLSRRSWQRRFRAVTGLSRKQIAQLERARRAYLLLQQGVRPADVALAAGYADQAHLTRSLRLIRGETPAQIVASTARRNEG